MVKRAIFGSLVLMLILSSCSVFQARDRARHVHLHKVPVNEQLVQHVAGADSVEAIAETDVTPLPENAVTELTVPVPAEENTKVAKNTAHTGLNRKAPGINPRTLLPEWKQKARAPYANDARMLDPVTLLIWVLIISVVLVLLGLLIPPLLQVFIGLLLVVLVLMAILYLAGTV